MGRKYSVTSEGVREMIQRLRRGARVYRIGEVPEIMEDAAEYIAQLDERIAIMSAEGPYPPGPLPPAAGEGGDH